MRSVLFGALCLVALEAALSSGEAAQRAGGILSGVAGLVDHLFNPSLPLIPDLSAGAGAPDPGGDGGGWTDQPGDGVGPSTKRGRKQAQAPGVHVL